MNYEFGNTVNQLTSPKNSLSAHSRTPERNQHLIGGYVKYGTHRAITLSEFC